MDTLSPIVYEGELLKRNVSKYRPNFYRINEKNDSLIVSDNHGFKYERQYYKTGELKILRIRKGNYQEFTAFYKNGNIHKQEHCFNIFDKCIYKEWNTDGVLIKYENEALNSK